MQIPGETDSYQYPFARGERVTDGNAKLFGSTVHEGCDRGGYYEQAQFAEEYGSPLCIVKLGCWGPMVQCNVGKRGWMGGIENADARDLISFLCPEGRTDFLR